MDHLPFRPTWQGQIGSIHIAHEGGAPMVVQAEAQAVAGRGLAGDRYYSETGFYSWYKGPLREVSLIEAEVIERLAQDHNIHLDSGESRRNIVTVGVPLGHLIGRSFRVGEAVFRGVEICEPCKRLVDLTGNQPVLSALIHRGGLHAEILSGGTIRPGDTIEEV